MNKAYFRVLPIAIIGIIICASITLVASAGAGSARVASRTSSPAEISGLKKRIGEIPAKVKTAPFLGYKAPAERIRLLLSFAPNDEAGLQQLISDLYNSDSPQYHQWLTPEQFGERFGRTPEELGRAVSWLQQQGMEVDRTYSNRLSIGFSGTVDSVQQAFQVQIATYFDVGNNTSFYSNTSAPTLPAELERITVGLEGLSNAVVYHRPTRIKKAKPVSANKQHGSGFQPQGRVGGFLFLLPQDLALLYDYAPLWNSNIKGAGQKVGIVIDSDVPDSDMTTYRTDAGLPAANLQRILYPGFSNPGLTGGEDEADLDTQNVSAIAPAAEIDLVLIPQLDSVSIQTVEQDIISQNTIHVVSESFGICESEGFSSAEQTIFNQAVTQGTAFFASSGDEGANCDELQPAFHGTECPACYGGVTSVGGTHLVANFDSNGNVTSRASEVVWNTPPGVRVNCSGGDTGGGAGGGGICSIVSMPAYQTTSQGFSGGVPAGNKRVVPDVTAIADPGPIGPLLVINGVLYYGGGTSQSSPLLAGMMALINQFKGAPQGSPNAVLYQLGVNQYKNGGPHAFLDITIGNNNVAPLSPCLPGGFAGFSAGTGYDAVSGWGAPDLNIIAQHYSGGAATNYTGYVDALGCNTIQGWAADRNRLNTSINVEIYDGTTLLTTVLASNSRPDVGAFLGDNGLHGFSVATPAALKDGNLHTVHLKFETSTTDLNNSPATVNCGMTNYIGYVDVMSCSTIQGWAADRNRLNASINVEVYDGGTLLTTVLASNSRADVGAFLGDNGLHGFSIATPAALKDGNPHSVHVKFETSTTDLINSPANLSCAGSAAYIGWVDHLGCDTIQGWAADRSRPNTSINVEIYNGTTLVMTVLASNSRPDVGAFLGDNGMHGFSVAFPASLKDGLSHSIHVKFETSSTELSNSPASLTCP